MNVPLGTQEIAGKEVTEETGRDILSFLDASKTGYFCITTMGEHGIEDALMVIEAGGVVGAHYEYLAFGKTYQAGEALKRVLNSLASPHGVYDSYTLTAQQLELLKIFNEGVLLLERVAVRSFEGMVPVSHSAEFEKLEVAAVPEQRKDVLGRHGLEEIKIDNYAEIKASVEAAAPKAETAAKVAEKVGAYLSGDEAPAPTPPSASTEPIAEPKIEEMEAPPKEAAPPVPVEEAIDAETTHELEELNQQAEKLKKLLLKEK